MTLATDTKFILTNGIESLRIDEPNGGFRICTNDSPLPLAEFDSEDEATGMFYEMEPEWANVLNVRAIN